MNIFVTDKFQIFIHYLQCMYIVCYEFVYVFNVFVNMYSFKKCIQCIVNFRMYLRYLQFPHRQC